MLLLLAAIGAGLWFWSRRRRTAAPAPRGSLNVVRKVALGARSALVIVEADGQRLLLGVTPASIQCLASLTDPPEALAEAPAESAALATPGDDAESVASRRAADPAVTVARRFDAILDAARTERPRTPAKPTTERAPARSASAARRAVNADDDAFDEQARGLRALGGGT